MVKLCAAATRFVIDSFVIKLKWAVAGVNCYWDGTNGSRGSLKGRLVTRCDIHKASVCCTDIRYVEVTSTNLQRKLCKFRIQITLSLSDIQIKQNWQTTKTGVKGNTPPRWDSSPLQTTHQHFIRFPLQFSSTHKFYIHRPNYGFRALFDCASQNQNQTNHKDQSEQRQISQGANENSK